MQKKRVQSPSSINTYRQCPRKYYYQYVLRLETKQNVHQVRGNIAHSVLDSFFDIEPAELNESNYEEKLRQRVQQLLLLHWRKSEQELAKLQLNMDQRSFYFEETLLMLMNWTNHIVEQLQMVEGNSVAEKFQLLTPIREKKFESETFAVQGFVDAIHQQGDDVHIIDYKTNANFEITEEQRLQLAIYALLYHEKFGKMPSKAGIFFLRSKLKMMPIDESLIDFAKREIKDIHQKTQSTDIIDYPRHVGPLCKWSSGQCDFYEACKPWEEKRNKGSHM